MQINVLLDNGVFKYSVGQTPPKHSTFVHHFDVKDQITWHYWNSDQKVTVAFETDICPFAGMDGTPWPGKTATFPDEQAARIHASFDTNRMHSRIKYSVTLPDAPGAPKDDPEVIIVDA